MENKKLKASIAKSVAVKMTNAYSDLKKEVDDGKGSGGKKSDTLSIFIRKSRIEEFFKMNSEANGVRIYFGVVNDYDVTDENGITYRYQCIKDYINQTNLIFVPTKSKFINPTSADSDNLSLQKDEDGNPIFTGYIDDEYEMCPPPALNCRPIV